MLLGVLLPAQHSLPRRELSRVVNKCWAVTQSQTLAGGDRPKPVQAALTAAVLITHSLCAATERPKPFFLHIFFEIGQLRFVLSGLILQNMYVVNELQFTSAQFAFIETQV